MAMIAFNELLNRERCISVVGLGYVGLPLAVALARHFCLIGFDIKSERIKALKNGHDSTHEVDERELADCQAFFTDNPEELLRASVHIIAVPTPVDSHNKPDLSPVISASQVVGRYLSPGSVVCYESTVYPGVTEDVCVPILEKTSGLRFPQDFTVGYSPERINPGDKVHRLESICKIVSGSDKATADLLAQVYGSVVKAGIHRASTIKVAEAAKVIENTQRDINIALMNELAIIFNKMNIDTLDVLEAAGSKWNFIPFKPGLVGGHCIGVDPYYLTYKAEEMGLLPAMILAGRRINSGMGKYVAETCIKKLINAGKHIKGVRIGILGVTFKENVPDIRNSRIIDIISELADYGAVILVHDPEADQKEVFEVYSLNLSSLEDLKNLDALIMAVPHDKFKTLDAIAIKKMFSPNKALLLDLKGFWDRQAMREAGFNLWRL